MNGIIQEEKRFQASGSHGSLDSANWWTHGPERNQYTNRQILLESSFPQDEFAAELEHAHWGLNE